SSRPSITPHRSIVSPHNERRRESSLGLLSDFRFVNSKASAPAEPLRALRSLGARTPETTSRPQPPRSALQGSASPRLRVKPSVSSPNERRRESSLVPRGDQSP